MKNKIKILMASAEIAPLAKAGGLADVIGSLPPALKKLNCDVRLIMPLYGSVNRRKYNIKKIKSNIVIISNNHKIKINLYETKLPKTNVKIYLIENKKYFGDKEIYTKHNAEKFLFFSLSTLNILRIIKFMPDIIHCHDFHTALISDLIKVSPDPEIKDIKTIFTIHNLNHQGITGIKTLATGNLSKNSLKSLTRDAQDGDINFMVQGILNSNIITTVSKTYAKEITTSIYGAHLERIIRMRKKDVHGVVNGIDINFFNPSKDKFIVKKYSIKSLKNKAINKLALQKEVGLPQTKNVPLVGLVSRLVWQKGLELITEDFAKLDCQFVFLGTGQKKYEQHLTKLAKKYPNKFASKIMFDVGLAQRIYAGSDMFLMPSRFEPCGLGQMIAMRYGTVPVVRSTGGLADTVDSKVGFKFKEFSNKALLKSLKKACNTYYKKPKEWEKIQKNGMKKDFSWDNSAKEYLRLYKKILK